MIALITSCINPFKEQDLLNKSYLNVEQRLKQTINSISRLAAFPFNKIYLLDNSNKFDFNLLTGKVADQLIVRHFQQYQFKNKGINELLLLLSILNELPENEKIFKISGRYYPNRDFICDLNEELDFKFKDYNFYSKRGTVSTRAYFVKNKQVYEQFLLECITEVFSYPKRIVGIRSAINAIKEIIKSKVSSESNTSIEFACARVLKNQAYNIQLVNVIGIEGQIAGFANLELIKE